MFLFAASLPLGAGWSLGEEQSWRGVGLLEMSPHANLEPRCQPEQ